MKDATSGKMQTRQFEVEGPIAYLETTTNAYLNPENTSRCFEIPLDESVAQTERIHEHQRRSRSFIGLKNKVATSGIRNKHHNAQRLLERIWVVIPFAEKLVFPARYLRTRRDHERFLSLIEVAAFLHQHQRPRKTANLDGISTTYIEATVDDYALAYRLALRVLWVSLDELSRWSRELVDWMREETESHCRTAPKKPAGAVVNCASRCSGPTAACASLCRSWWSMNTSRPCAAARARPTSIA